MLTDFIRAFRGLRASPALAVVAVFSLALGIGPNVTIYSVVREMILDDLSARRPDQLARIATDVSYGRYRELRDAPVFQDLAFDAGLRDINWDTGTHGEIVWQMATSANFFDVLGVSASSGRLYSTTDAGNPAAVVSYGFWRERLAGDDHILGRALKLNGSLYTVSGVLPRDYRSILGHGVSPEVYVIAGHDSGNCHPFGRLREGRTRNQTREALMAAARNFDSEDFARSLVLRPMAGLAAQTASEGNDRSFFVFFVMLFGTAVLLTLIACLNIGALLLARVVSRQRELAVRKALGASRGHIVRQLLVEGAVLVTLGSAAGLALDTFLRQKLSYIRWPSAYNLPFEFHFQSDRGLLLYALAAATATLLLSSILPALRGSAADLGLAMKQGEPAFSIRRWSLRNGFVALQVTFSVVLLTLGLLLARSFLHLSHSNPGFDVASTVIVRIHPPPGLSRREAGWVWRDRNVELIKQVPGVIGVTSISNLPLMGELQENHFVHRRGDTDGADANELGGGEQFCRVLGIRMLRGRDFEIADRTRQPEPVILNETFARRLFRDSDPIGEEIEIGHEQPRILQVIGVAADAKLRTLGENHPAVFFTPFSFAQLVVATSGNGAQWVEPLRNALGNIDAGAAVEIRPMAQAVAGALFPTRVAAVFAGCLAAIGLVLTLTGLYSSVSYATRRRTREMAIRSAVGATRPRILWTAIRDGIGVLLCGVAAGLPLAIAAVRPLTGILPDGLDPWSIGMFAVVALVLVLVGAGAAWIPARDVCDVDPAISLREQLRDWGLGLGDR